MGVKEGLLDYEHLAAYLLYRLNSIPPSPSIPPPYPPLLRRPSKSRQPLRLTESIDTFLDELAERMGYLLSGGVRDRQRAARWFVEWWRDSGGAALEGDETSIDGGIGVGGSEEWGWGLDCQWADRHENPSDVHLEQRPPSSAVGVMPTLVSPEKSMTPTRRDEPSTLESRFDLVISRYLSAIRDLEGEMSETQMKKQEKEERQRRRIQRSDEVAKKRADALRRRTKR